MESPRLTMTRDVALGGVAASSTARTTGGILKEAEMTERKLPDLVELDRVERETEPDAFVPQEEMEFLWGQLRPLLDLVDGMGKALEVAVPNLQTATQWREDDPDYRQVDDALADYQQAKGGSP